MADLETKELLGPHAPSYWNEDGSVLRVADVDPEVKQQIRTLAYETGVAGELSGDWSLQDLGTGPLSEVLEMMNETTDST